MRLILGIFSLLVVANAFADDSPNSYRIQPPDYTLQEFPYLVGNKYLRPIFWTKSGTEGGVRPNPPNEMVHNEDERRQASGWKPFQFFVALHGLPIAQPRWVPTSTPLSFTREEEIARLTDHFLHYPNVTSAQQARDMATRYFDANYRIWKRRVWRPMRPSAAKAMVDCWAKQTTAIEMFVNRFATSPLFDAYIKKGGSINPWINVQHVWVPGAKNTHQGGKRADFINGTIVIVPGGVDRGANCNVASVSDIWAGVARVMHPATVGEAHPDAGMPAHMVHPIFGLKVLMGSTPYIDDNHKNACIILDHYYHYKSWYDLHPREYKIFYNDRYVKYVVGYLSAHPDFKNDAGSLYRSCH